MFKENKIIDNKKYIIIITAIIIILLLTSSIIFSLFNKELFIENIENSNTIIQPIIEDNTKNVSNNTNNDINTISPNKDSYYRKLNVQNIADAPNISLESRVEKPLDYNFNHLNKINPNTGSNYVPSAPSGRTGDEGSGGPPGTGLTKPREVPPPKDDDEPPPQKPTPTPPPKTPPPTPEKTPPPPPKIVSGSVVNGKAVSLVKPPYPPIAKAVGAKGKVEVQVVIDEEGNVISASAISGHPLLQPAAVAAARASKFSPTLLSGIPVKVSGIVIYNFQ